MEYVANPEADLGRGATILPNAHALDPHLKKMKVLADRIVLHPW